MVDGDGRRGMNDLNRCSVAGLVLVRFLLADLAQQFNTQLGHLLFKISFDLALLGQLLLLT